MTTTTDRLAEHIAAIPLLDHHCHAPWRLPQAIDGPTLRAPFTESTDPDVRTGDVPQTLVYRSLIRWLSGLLGCDPTEDAVLRARAGYIPEDYQRLLADDAVLSDLYDDYLFGEGETHAPDEWTALTGRPVRTILRVETVAERLLPSATSWEGFRQEFGGALAAGRSRGAVAFKSIAAYRSGLAIQRVDASGAAEAFDDVRAELEAGGSHRLANKPLIDALLWETLEVASELAMPVQVHVGLGDDDVFLPASNPALMRAVYQEPRYRGVPLVLLHNYPFVREAAYLASVYPNVYVDLGLTVPLAGPDCPALLRQAIGLAPLSKVLASSDGHGVPEFQWLAAHTWRRTLVQALAEVVDAGVLSDAEASEAAAMILHANAELIYPR